MTETETETETETGVDRLEWIMNCLSDAPDRGSGPGPAGTALAHRYRATTNRGRAELLAEAVHWRTDDPAVLGVGAVVTLASTHAYVKTGEQWRETTLHSGTRYLAVQLVIPGVRAATVVFAP